ncbi:MAG TPA: hypothetical protein ENN75_03780 [candidate division Zixibacteria bacterium]|nr:hypothetical protein [candidate division Zixibacteria bacterium]
MSKYYKVAMPYRKLKLPYSLKKLPKSPHSTGKDNFLLQGMAEGGIFEVTKRRYYENESYLFNYLLLIIALSAFGWEMAYFEDDYAEFLDVLLLPDTSLAFLTHFTFALRTCGILFANDDGDSLGLVSWDQIKVRGMELIDDSTHLAIGDYVYLGSFDSASLFQPSTVIHCPSFDPSTGSGTGATARIVYLK